MMRANLVMVVGASALALSACGKAEKTAPAAGAAENANNVLTEQQALTRTPTLKPATAPTPLPTRTPYIPGGQVVSDAVTGLGAATNAALVGEVPIVGSGTPKLQPTPAASNPTGASAPFIPGGSVVSSAAAGKARANQALKNSGGD